MSSAVIRIIAEILLIEESDILPESHLRRDLGADSLDVIEITIALEDELGIDLSPQDVSRCATITEFIELAEKAAQ